MEALNFSIEGEKEVDDDLAILCTYFPPRVRLRGIQVWKTVINQSIIDKLQNPKHESKQANMSDKNEHLTTSIMWEMKTKLVRKRLYSNLICAFRGAELLSLCICRLDKRS